MKLVVDANIPMAAQAFAHFGEVVSLPGRNMTPADVADADALIVRSVTKVNAALLDASKVRFVGTATIGTDHLDIAYLNQRGIAWASAQGCNARSVVEYVVAAIVEHCVRREESWAGRTLGIIGHGNIGSRLAPVARALGIKVIVNDPPLARVNGGQGFVDLNTVLSQSDFISIHVPLIKTGQDRTVHLLGERELKTPRDGTLLINAARGEVIDNAALLQELGKEHRHLTAVLDVFENEPRPDKGLVSRCLFATPHIAGYSYEGKINGTRMMVEALARFAGLPIRFSPMLPVPMPNLVDLSPGTPEEMILQAIRTSYDIREDHDNLLREAHTDADWGEHFDTLRKNYRKRREFSNYTVRGITDMKVAKALQVLGFNPGTLSIE